MIIAAGSSTNEVKAIQYLNHHFFAFLFFCFFVCVCFFFNLVIYILLIHFRIIQAHQIPTMQYIVFNAYLSRNKVWKLKFRSC